MQITSVPYVNGTNFGDWFNQNRLFWGNFPHEVNVRKFSDIFRNLRRLTGQNSVSLDGFLGLFLFIYNETGGTFTSMAELGSREYIENAGPGKVAYTWKEKGRGLNQLTSAANYRVVLSKLGYSYDALSAEQLDALFLQPKVYFEAFRIYITDTQLAGRAWNNLNNGGDFRGFGRAISGGSAYGELMNTRANILKQALAQKNITSETLSPTTRNVLVGSALIIGLGSLYYYGGFGNIGN